MNNYIYARQHELFSQRLGQKTFISDLLCEEKPRVHYPHTLNVPIGINSETKEIVALDLGSQDDKKTGCSNSFILILGKTGSGKSVLCKSIESRLQLYGGFSIANVADIKNEAYGFFTQVSRSIPEYLHPSGNENSEGEKKVYEYYSFVENEDDKRYMPRYIKNTLKQPEDIETNRYRSLEELAKLPFLKNLKTTLPVFTYSHFGQDNTKLNTALTWTLDKFYTYAKLKNNYGENIKERIILTGEEMQRYADGKGGKDIKEVRTMMEEIASRGRSVGIGGLFVTQGYKSISPKVRGAARFKILIAGYFSNDDRDELLKEMEINDKYKKQKFSNLQFEYGKRECLLCDNFTKEITKFFPFSPLIWADPII